MAAFNEDTVKDVIEQHCIQLHINSLDLVTVNMVPLGTKAWDKMVVIWNGLVELTKVSLGLILSGVC